MSDIVPALLDSRDQGGDSTFFDTNSFSPPANQTILLACCTIGQVVPPSPVVPTCVGNGLPWTLVGTVLFDFSGTDRSRLTVYRGLSASPTIGTTRVTYNTTQFRQGIFVFSFSQTDIGNLGANAIVGTPVTAKVALAGTVNPSITVPAGENVANSGIGIISYAAPNPSVISGVGFIPLLNLPTAEGMGQQIQMSQVVLTTVDWTLGAQPGCGMIGIELRNANPLPAQVPAPGKSAFIGGNLIN